MSRSLNPALNAQIVIDISADKLLGKVLYSVTTHESDIAGVNQLADLVRESVLKSLPNCTETIGVQE